MSEQMDCNSHEAMRSTLLKIKDWLTKQVVQCDAEARDCRFISLKQAYLADAKNYRAVVNEIDAALTEGKP